MGGNAGPTPAKNAHTGDTAATASPTTGPQDNKETINNKFTAVPVMN